MEFDAKPVKLKRETQELLGRLRSAGKPLPVYGIAAGPAEAAVYAIADPMLEGAALPLVRTQQLRWYVRELARVLRTRTGPPLVFQLGFVLRKWVAYGIDPETAQFLLQELVRGLEEPATAGGER